MKDNFFYGNADTTYITVNVDEMDKDVVIDDVENVTTGIKNVSIDVYSRAKALKEAKLTSSAMSLTASTPSMMAAMLWLPSSSVMTALPPTSSLSCTALPRRRATASLRSCTLGSWTPSLTARRPTITLQV